MDDDENPANAPHLIEMRLDVAKVSIKTALALKSINTALAHLAAGDKYAVLDQIEKIDALTNEIWEVYAQNMGKAADEYL
ncbi:hypothetical protein [Novosphingobium sp. KA1]|uniref:hypothetical protein n=1 Tax=Novosphingobium sp. (strain KA1) TaxID=164608 RepID=UPI001A8E3646|nr:hypothetical protein [Novosphingobium sp. KA1]QSR18441.1 hypothetical protein CA833_14800 [Novosphingobium sp. KA1]